MGLGQRAATLNRHAGKSFVRHGDARALLQLGFALAGLGALVAFLVTTVDWYWHALGWLGVLYAVLLSWILSGAGLITYRDLFHPSWLPRAKGLGARPKSEHQISTSESRGELEQTVTALGNDFFAFRNEVVPKMNSLDDTVIPVVRAHARMILLLMDRDEFSRCVAEFEKFGHAIKAGFLGQEPAGPGIDAGAFEQLRAAMAKLFRDDFGEIIDLWPDLKTAENLPAAPNDRMISDPARQREYRDFHRRYGAASRLIQEFKGRYNSEMERATEIVTSYARDVSGSPEP